jgi:hypothetical protein
MMALVEVVKSKGSGVTGGMLWKDVSSPLSLSVCHSLLPGPYEVNSLSHMLPLTTGQETQSHEPME